MKNKTFKQIYSKWAKATAEIAGSSYVFIGAISVVLIWAISGPFFDFSETWQLVINTGTTIITFLMIFLIQNTQNRDTEAIQVKLEELIRVSSKARNQLIDMEEKDEEEIRKRAGPGNSDRWIKDDSSAFWANNVGQERRNHESQTTQKPLARL